MGESRQSRRYPHRLSGRVFTKLTIGLRWLCAIALLATSPATPAQPGSDRGAGNAPARVIVPFLQSGIADSVARIVVNKVNATASERYSVENHPGDDGHFGAELAAKAEPDGRTLLFAPIVSLAAAVSLHARLHYDLLADFAPVTLIANVPHVLLVHPSLPVKTVADVIAIAKARPGQLRWATHGRSSLSQLELELFRNLSGIRVAAAPYNASSEALPELLSGNVDLLFDSIGAAQPHLQSGRLRGIAVASARRSPALPRLPTVAEAGVRNFEANYWYAVLAPEGTAGTAIDRVQRGFAGALAAADVKDRLLHYGIEPRASTPAELAQIVRGEIAKWAQVISRAGLKRE